MAFLTGNFRVVLNSPIPMTTGYTQIEGEGVGVTPDEGWRIVMSMKSAFADPWPNTEFGGHEVHGGSLQIYKGDELKYSCDGNIEWHVWRDEENRPRRIYAENTLIPSDPHDWEIGGPAPDYDNVAYENGQWIFSCFWQGAPGVIP